MKRVSFTQSLRWSCLSLMLLAGVTAEADYSLFRGGKSAYQIVVPTTASRSEQTAARELQSYVKQISGAELPVTNLPKGKGPKIYVGYSLQVKQLVGKRMIPKDYEGFTYRNIGPNVVIYGGSQRGTMYGVFRFLERELGVRWCTPKFTVVPKKDSWSFSKLCDSEKPSIQYRYSNYYATEDPAWCAHNLENMKWGPLENDYGNLEAYWNCHTMGQFISSGEYYKDHPEYFALKDGKRVSDYAQLCLSNPDVLRICKEKLEKVMKEQPLNRIYSLSQNDNCTYCQCDKCKAIEDKYGGHSGLIIWFVNQVADALKDEFPDKYIGTFAYQYTRKPPVGIQPRENVVIRLCNIECCFAHPMTAGCEQNKSFMRDFEGWSKIAPHMFIWDYVVNFHQYVAPFPNFGVLGPNIKAFRDNKAIGVFEEAAYQGAGGEFADMKAWVLDKLMWNPEQNTDSLAKDFCYSFYGKAAPKIYEYYRLCQDLVKPDTHFGIYFDEHDKIYTEDFIDKSMELMDDAEKAADTETIKEHVDLVYLQVLYLRCMRDIPKAKEDGTWDEFCRLGRKYKVVFSEGDRGCNLDTFVKWCEEGKK